ncbi:MAG: MtrB/PioB family decaheme-associated outer membrane protein [Porticoccaceae bacterium]
MRIIGKAASRFYLRQGADLRRAYGIVVLLVFHINPVWAEEITGTLDLNLGLLTDSAPSDTRMDLHLFVEEGDQQSLELHYQQSPTDGPGIGQTPYLRNGTNFNLPAGWVATGNNTAGFSQLQESLNPVDLWRERRTLKLDYRRTLNPDWHLTFNLRRDQVDGIRALGAVTGATGGNVRAAMLGAPLDRETHTIELGIGHNSQRHRWQLSYLGSFFDNGYDRLTWNTAFDAHPQWGAATGYPDGRNQMATEPDNQAHQIRALSHWTLAPRTRLLIDGNLGRHSQNQRFLPYTINEALNVSEALPRDSLDGRVDITRLNLRLTHSAGTRLHLTGRMSYQDRDNQTPVAAYQRVRGDVTDQQDFADARLNRPYSRTRQQVSLDANYRLDRDLRLRASLSHETLKRDYSEVAESDEQELRLGVNSTRFDSLALSLDYRYLRRRSDDYVGNRPLIATHLPGTIAEDDFENHPLLRKYYLADRDRQQWQARGDWYIDSNLSLGLAAAYNEDDYPSGYFGLERSNMTSITADLTYHPSEYLGLSAYIGRDYYRSDQSGRSFRGSVPADAGNPMRDWQVDARDRYISTGINLDWDDIVLPLGQWRPEVDFALNISRSEAEGRYQTEVGADLMSAPLPAVTSDFDRIEASVRHALNDRSRVYLALEWEYYRSQDFAWNGVAPDTLNGVLLMGEGGAGYRQTWAHLGYRYRF